MHLNEKCVGMTVLVVISQLVSWGFVSCNLFLNVHACTECAALSNSNAHMMVYSRVLGQPRK